MRIFLFLLFSKYFKQYFGVQKVVHNGVQKVVHKLVQMGVFHFLDTLKLACVLLPAVKCPVVFCGDVGAFRPRPHVSE